MAFTFSQGSKLAVALACDRIQASATPKPPRHFDQADLMPDEYQLSSVYNRHQEKTSVRHRTRMLAATRSTAAHK
jgi:hypothetical protein